MNQRSAVVKWWRWESIFPYLSGRGSWHSGAPCWKSNHERIPLDSRRDISDISLPWSVGGGAMTHSQKAGHHASTSKGKRIYTCLHVPGFQNVPEGP